MRRQEPTWIDLRDALAIHERILSLHGGASGLRDKALLESALARPRQRYTYDSSATIVEMAALYSAGIIRNHPFIDGNKTGFVSGIVFLELNGYEFHADEAEATRVVMALTEGKLDEGTYAKWLEENARRRRR